MNFEKQAFDEKFGPRRSIAFSPAKIHQYIEMPVASSFYLDTMFSQEFLATISKQGELFHADLRIEDCQIKAFLKGNLIGIFKQVDQAKYIGQMRKLSVFQSGGRARILIQRSIENQYIVMVVPTSLPPFL